MNNIEIALEETMYEMIFSDIPETNYKIHHSFDRRMKKMIRSYLADNTLDKSVHKSKKRWRYIIIIAVTLVLTITAAAVICNHSVCTAVILGHKLRQLVHERKQCLCICLFHYIGFLSGGG